MLSRLLLAEHDYQVRDLINRGLDDDCQWIALGPSAMACLDSLGVVYQIPEDFYSDEEFARFCDETHRQVERLCDSLDSRLLDSYPELRSLGMTPFRFHIFLLMMIFDAVRSRVFQLGKIFAAYPGHTIHIHSRNYRWNSESLLFHNAETLWGNVASLSKSHAHVRILPDAPASQSPTAAEPSRLPNFDIKKYLLKSLLLTSAARLLSSKDYRGLLNLFRRSEQTCLVVNAPYEWATILSAFIKDGKRILFVSEDYFRSESNIRSELPALDNFDQLMHESGLIHEFTFGGFDYYPLLKARLAWIWETSPQQFMAVTRTLADLNSRHRISALLRCSSASGIDHAINQSAKVLGIPVFTWQHGAVSYGPRITQFRDYADRMTADYTFVYGEEAEAAYTRHGREFPAKVVPIGAPSLDSIARTNGRSGNGHPVVDGSRIRILYATSNFMQNHWYCGWQPPFSDRQFFRDQSLIVNYLKSAALAGIADTVIKLHPSKEYHQPAWITGLKDVRGIREVKDERSFKQLLAEADVVVVDFPSTVLLQAIATALPVFVLVRHWRFPREAAATLERRAIASPCAEQLTSRLKEFLETHDYGADATETSFLEGAGTYYNDGKSHERAIAFVSNILASRN